MNIAHLTYAVAQHSEHIAALSARLAIPEKESIVFEKLMGLRFIPRENRVTQYDQLCSVFEKFIQEYVIDLESVRYVFFAHTADDVSPVSVPILGDFVKRYGLEKSIYFGSSSHKCACAFQFLRLSKILFQSMDNQDSILLIVADISFTKILQFIPGSTVMGDASCVVLLKKNAQYHQIIDVLLEEEGRFSKGVFGNKEEQLLFQSIYTEKLSHIISNIIDKNNLCFDDIKWIFPHNVNTISWKQISSYLKISINKIYLDNVAKTGHCFGSDPFINLCDAISDKKIAPGDYYILATVGLGATFSVALLQY